MRDKAQTLQALYDSEINFEISTFWDGGFDWKLGDSSNGFVADGTTLTVHEAIAQLAVAAHKHFPQSLFHLGAEEFERRQKEKAK